MGGDIVGLVAVVMFFVIPLTGMALYSYYRVNKLRTEERLAAIARGVNVPVVPELSQAARSRRAGILLVSAALGYVTTFAFITRVEPDAWVPGRSAPSRSRWDWDSSSIQRLSGGTPAQGKDYEHRSHQVIATPPQESCSCGSASGGWRRSIGFCAFTRTDGGYGRP